MRRVLGFALSILIAISASASTVQQRASRNDMVLAAGEPALTQAMVEDVAGFFEWAFAAQMSDTQRGQLRQILLAVWESGNQSDINGVRQLLELNAKLAGLTPQQKESVRAELEPKLLETLRTPPVDDFSKLMLSVHANRSSMGATTGTGLPTGAPSAVETPSVNSLVGEWKNGYISTMVQYQDTITKSTTPGRGTTFSYKFHPDGRFEFVGYMQTTMYNCTTTVFNPMSGVYQVQGSQLVLTPHKNEWQMRSPCYPSQNKDRQGKMDPMVYTWRIKQENGRQNLCLASSSSEGEACYQKD
jgi:hypothetical protein